MIKFFWEYITHGSGNTYISWDAKWDGRWDNDPFISKKDVNEFTPDELLEFWGHPFINTLDYEQEEEIYNHYKILSGEKNLNGDTLNNNGSLLSRLHRNNNKNIDPEDYHPSKLMQCGDFVAVNVVTRELCEMLSNDEMIIATCGNTHPFSYRAKLLGCLSLLWD